jgi:hypothetical protein
MDLGSQRISPDTTKERNKYSMIGKILQMHFMNTLAFFCLFRINIGASKRLNNFELGVRGKF